MPSSAHSQAAARVNARIDSLTAAYAPKPFASQRLAAVLASEMWPTQFHHSQHGHWPGLKARIKIHITDEFEFT